MKITKLENELTSGNSHVEGGEGQKEQGAQRQSNFDKLGKGVLRRMVSLLTFYKIIQICGSMLADHVPKHFYI